MNIQEYKKATKELKEFTLWSFKERAKRGHLKKGEFLFTATDRLSPAFKKITEALNKATSKFILFDFLKDAIPNGK